MVLQNDFDVVADVFKLHIQIVPSDVLRNIVEHVVCGPHWHE